MQKQYLDPTKMDREWALRKLSSWDYVSEAEKLDEVLSEIELHAHYGSLERIESYVSFLLEQHQRLWELVHALVIAETDPPADSSGLPFPSS